MDIEILRDENIHINSIEKVIDFSHDDTPGRMTIVAEALDDDPKVISGFFDTPSETKYNFQIFQETWFDSQLNGCLSVND